MEGVMVCAARCTTFCPVIACDLRREGSCQRSWCTQHIIVFCSFAACNGNHACGFAACGGHLVFESSFDELLEQLQTCRVRSGHTTRHIGHSVMPRYAPIELHHVTLRLAFFRVHVRLFWAVFPIKPECRAYQHASSSGAADVRHQGVLHARAARRHRQPAAADKTGAPQLVALEGCSPFSCHRGFATLRTCHVSCSWQVLQENVASLKTLTCSRCLVAIVSARSSVYICSSKRLNFSCNATHETVMHVGRGHVSFAAGSSVTYTRTVHVHTSDFLASALVAMEASDLTQPSSWSLAVRLAAVSVLVILGTAPCASLIVVGQRLLCVDTGCVASVRASRPASMLSPSFRSQLFSPVLPRVSASHSSLRACMWVCLCRRQ